MRMPILTRTVVATDPGGNTYRVEHRSQMADVTAPAQASQLVTTRDLSGLLLALRVVVLDETGTEVYRTAVPTRCAECGSRAFDPDLEFVDETGYECPGCSANVFYIDPGAEVAA